MTGFGPDNGQTPGAPGGGQQDPSREPAQNPYASAQSAIAGAGGTLNGLRYGLGGLGVLMALGGLGLMIFSSFSAGLGLLITGVVLAGVAIFVLPRFIDMVGSASATVDGLAAKANLAQTGIPATGRIVQIQQTGTMVNHQPQVAATIEVTHPNTGAQYQAQTTAVVPQIAIPQVQPGAQVQIRINPHNPMDVALVF